MDKKKEIIFYIITLFILFSFVLILEGVGKERIEDKVYKVEELIPAKVIKIVDGDTIWVKIINRKYKVRLIGVNTPEIEHKNLHIAEQPYGEKAKQFTWYYLHDRKVWLELDLFWFDKYNRLLAYVWLKPIKLATLDSLTNYQFNAILLTNGYAKVMRVRPNLKYHKTYLYLQKQAKNNHVNIWK